MNGQWKHINDFPPPTRTPVLGFDVFQSVCHVCEWDGKNMDDDGEIRLEDEGAQSDDYYIAYWMELPNDPNVARPAEEEDSMPLNIMVKDGE